MGFKALKCGLWGISDLGRRLRLQDVGLGLQIHSLRFGFQRSGLSGTEHQVLGHFRKA